MDRKLGKSPLYSTTRDIVAFIKDEVEKDEVPMPDVTEHIPSPQPRHMIELEVRAPLLILLDSLL